MRSRLDLFESMCSLFGIISACAEQTPRPECSNLATGDHLRVCGADKPARCCRARAWGSSPRVRSRLRTGRFSGTLPRIISACAEQTHWRMWLMSLFWDHLRVCGADTMPSIPAGTALGSSPRVRSRLLDEGAFGLFGGIISACAEQTS